MRLSPLHPPPQCSLRSPLPHGLQWMKLLSFTAGDIVEQVKYQIKSGSALKTGMQGLHFLFLWHTQKGNTIYKLDQKWVEGLPCRSSGQDSALPLQRALVPSLVGELRSPIWWGAAKIKKKIESKEMDRGLPGGAVVENPPANAGDTGSMPGPGRSHMPQSN